MKALDVISQAALEFMDPGYERISVSAWLGHLHKALLMVAGVRPDVFATSYKMPLLAGSTRQSLPDGYISLSRVVCNMTEGGVRGRIVTATSMDNLNDALSNWHDEDPADVVEHYAKNDSERDAFYVYPPPAENVFLEIVAAPIPALPASLEAVLPDVKDVELPALVVAVLHWAYRLNMESAVSKQHSSDCLGQMFLLLGREKEAEILMSQKDAEDGNAG